MKRQIRIRPDFVQSCGHSEDTLLAKLTKGGAASLGANVSFRLLNLDEKRKNEDLRPQFRTLSSSGINVDGRVLLQCKLKRA